jgi:hypothetical protein
MKTKKTTWIIKATFITEDLEYVIRHITMFDSTKEEVLRYARSLDGCSTLSVYKLDTVL